MNFPAALIPTMRTAMVLALIFVSTALEAADTQEIHKRAIQDLAIEYAECGAYFAYIATGIQRSYPAGAATDKEVADWKNATATALNMASTLDNKDRTMAVVKLTKDKIDRLTKGTYENVAMAQAEYAYRCKDLMDDPKARTKYWVDKERAGAAK
jgi:hypothetical protein